MASTRSSGVLSLLLLTISQRSFKKVLNTYSSTRVPVLKVLNIVAALALASASSLLLAASSAALEPPPTGTELEVVSLSLAEH